jgi:hypothetical protein
VPLSSPTRTAFRPVAPVAPRLVAPVAPGPTAPVAPRPAPTHRLGPATAQTDPVVPDGVR